MCALHPPFIRLTSQATTANVATAAPYPRHVGRFVGFFTVLMIIA
jgi:hypothetical protein